MFSFLFPESAIRPVKALFFRHGTVAFCLTKLGVITRLFPSPFRINDACSASRNPPQQHRRGDAENAEESSRIRGERGLGDSLRACAEEGRRRRGEGPR